MCRGIDTHGKTGVREMLTGWAADFFHLMLYDLQTDRWNIVYLTALFDGTCFLVQIELAGFTMGGTVRDDSIWSQDL